MSAEIRALPTSVPVTVTRVTTVPMHLQVVGDTVYVYPMQGVEIKVTAGTLLWDGFETIAWPGAAIEFKNEVAKEIGMDGISSFQVAYAISTKSLEFGAFSGNVTFRVDSHTGTIFASEPCDALVIFGPKNVQYNRYKYKGPALTYAKTAFTASSGSATQLDSAISQIHSATVYAIYKPMGWPAYKAQIQTKSIQMPEGGDYEGYRLNVPTVLNSEGEWLKPKDWDSDSYNPDKAYTDASGKTYPGPSKDDGYAGNNQTVLHGKLDINGKLTHKQAALPALKGLEHTKPEDIEKKLVISELHPDVLPLATNAKRNAETLEAIKAKYGVSASDVSTASAPIPITATAKQYKSPLLD